MLHSSADARRSLIASLIGIAAAALFVAAPLGCASTGAQPPARLTTESLEARRERAASLAEQAARLEQSNPERALQLYRDSIAAFPEFPAVWHNLGEFLKSRGEFLPAAEALQTAARLQPTEPRSPYLLGTIYYELRYYDEARAHFERSVQRDPNFLPAIRGLVAVVSTDRGADEPTLRLIERALLLERDRDWITFFQNERLRIEADLDRRERRVAG